ncbi:MAG: phosphatidate cytidylyltransferase, partial [Bacteroidales bacterium]|nr:phosphatidate cytidylyltransferase [Bacteroidales bacterium]
MPDILKRTVFGALFVAITCFMLLFSPHTCAVYMAVCSVLLLYEFLKMFNFSKARIVLTVVVGFLTVAASYGAYYWGNSLFLIVLLMSVLMFVVQLFTDEPHQEQMLGKQILALVYIVLPLCLAAYFGQKCGQLIMSTFILIWISDTMAYLVGCKFGKHKIFERVSPKKSWEG